MGYNNGYHNHNHNHRNNNNHNHNNNNHQLQHNNYAFTLSTPISNTSTSSSLVTTNINVPPLLPPSSPSTTVPSSRIPPVFATAPSTFITRTGNTYRKTENNKNRRSIIRTAYFTPMYRDDEDTKYVAEKHRCNFCGKDDVNKHTQQIVNHLLTCSVASAEAKSMFFIFYIFFI